MNPPSRPLSLSATPRRSCVCRCLLSASLMVVILLGSAFILTKLNEESLFATVKNSLRRTNNVKCQNHRRPHGTEPLPRGMIAATSDLEMLPLWRTPDTPPTRLDHKGANSSVSLLAMAVGIKQKDLVGKMVQKFLSSSFAVMLFHYDGNLDGWKQFQWNDLVIHVSAVNQTKWWFAKRFLHPDIVAEYRYIFLWDEDLGVDNFNPQRYVSIVQREGLHISQPALDYEKSEVHHQITARVKGSIVHRWIYKSNTNGTEGCDEHSAAPPCTGWIELMAPVFSQASWRCVWHMIQNKLIHAWGLDTQLGYCAQGDRTKNIGVVDAEYIIHYCRPTLGGPEDNENSPQSNATNHRIEVRRESWNEMRIFQRRWARSAKSDKCWVDRYPVNSSPPAPSPEVQNVV